MNPQPLDEFLKALRQDPALATHSSLLRLSALSPEEVEEFKLGWAMLPAPSRHEVAAKLVGMTEENTDMDFSSVFLVCIDDSEASVRELAVRGLWESEDRVLVRRLTRLLNEDPSAQVRTAAALSLRRFAVLAQEGKLIERDAQRVRDALLAAIGRAKEDIEVRRRAIEAIGCFEDADVAGIIRKAYGSDDVRLKQSAVFAMGQSSNIEWLSRVVAEMESNEAAMRYEAVTAAGNLGDESIIPLIMRLVRDHDSQVQTAAIMALAAIGGPLAKRTLQQYVRSPDEVLQQAAQTALDNLEFDEDPLGLQFDR